MNWYIAKLVYRIAIGNGFNSTQFDEQIRLISSDNEKEAYDKAFDLGTKNEDAFLNATNNLVKWEFIGLSELSFLGELQDGAEICSRIHETAEDRSYIYYVQQKTKAFKNNAVLEIN